eukprot:2687436-Prymnesium_polylepis.1
MLRELSVAAAGSFRNASLDSVYIDARHDYEGALEDIQVWAAKVCPGGLLAGHDFTDRVSFTQRVAQAVLDFLRMPQGRGFSGGTRLYITAEHPSSWFIFRQPLRCASALG